MPLLFLRHAYQYTISLSSVPLPSPRESQNPTRRGYHLLWQFPRHSWKVPEPKLHLVVHLPSYLSLSFPRKILSNPNQQLPPSVTRPCRGSRFRRASQRLRHSPGSLFQELTSRQGGWPVFTYSYTKSSVCLQERRCHWTREAAAGISTLSLRLSYSIPLYGDIS